jgi:hypothetical protein
MPLQNVKGGDGFPAMKQRFSEESDPLNKTVNDGEYMIGDSDALDAALSDLGAKNFIFGARSVRLDLWDSGGGLVIELTLPEEYHDKPIDTILLSDLVLERFACCDENDAAESKSRFVRHLRDLANRIDSLSLAELIDEGEKIAYPSS